MPSAPRFLAGLIFNFLFWGFSFLRMGTAGLSAQAFGANNTLELNAILLRAMMLAVSISFKYFLTAAENPGNVWIVERLEAGSRYFCESLFWASQPKQAAKT
jgi:Na+-driven multidrug efflux pump